MRYVLLVLFCSACGFPRPAPIHDDAGAGGSIDAFIGGDAQTAGPDAQTVTPDAGPMDFTLTLGAPRIRISEGLSTSVTVMLGRNDYREEVSVQIAGLPSGITADTLTITGNNGELVLHSAPGATQGEAALTITAAGATKSHEAALSLLAMGAPGTVDHTLVTNGVLATLSGSGDAVAAQENGNVVVAGVFDGGLFVARYLSSGILDASFAGGVVQLHSTATIQVLRDVAVYPDGRVIVAGSFSMSGISKGFIVRLNNNGTADNSFGTAGRVELTLGIPGSADTVLTDIAIQPDGYILAAGTLAAKQTTGGVAVIARLASTGGIDSSFGENSGYTTVNLGGVFDVFNDIAIQSDGKILATGVATTPDSPSVAVFARFDTRGHLDHTFAGTGVAHINLPNSVRSISAMAIQPDGKIVGGGTGDGPNSGSSTYIVRLNDLDGSLDMSFGNKGVKKVSLSSTNSESVTSIAIQSDGKFVVDGFGANVFAPGHSNRAGILARIGNTTDVDIDGTYNGGIIRSDPSDGMDGANTEFNALAIDSDGRAVIAGRYLSGGEFPTVTILVSRYWP